MTQWYKSLPKSEGTTTSLERKLDPELQAILDAEKPPQLTRLVFTLFLVTLAWFGLGFLPWFAQEGDPRELSWGLTKAGEFGDSFGFINSLFSALAFAGVITAILLQRQELAEQRKELIITQWQLKKSAEAQRESQQELAKQANTNLHSAILSSLQGMHDYGKAQVELNEKENGKQTIRFVQELREAVLANILNNGQAADLSKELDGRLQRWADIALIVDRTSHLRTLVSQTLYRAEYDEETGSTVDVRRITGSDEANEENVRGIVDQLEKDLPKLNQALSRCLDSPEPFKQWLAVAKKKKFGALPDDLADRLENLKKFCDNALRRAEENRRKIP